MGPPRPRSPEHSSLRLRTSSIAIDGDIDDAVKLSNRSPSSSFNQNNLSLSQANNLPTMSSFEAHLEGQAKLLTNIWTELSVTQMLKILADHDNNVSDVANYLADLSANSAVPQSPKVKKERISYDSQVSSPTFRSSDEDGQIPDTHENGALPETVLNLRSKKEKPTGMAKAGEILEDSTNAKSNGINNGNSKLFREASLNTDDPSLKDRASSSQKVNMAKAKDLCRIFPKAKLNECLSILQICDGDTHGAYEMLKEDYELYSPEGGEEIVNEKHSVSENDSKESVEEGDVEHSGEESEEADDDNIGNGSDTEDEMSDGSIKMAYSIWKGEKRLAESSDDENPIKKARRRIEEEEEASRPVTKNWYTWLSDEGDCYHVQLDSTIHPCRFPQNLLVRFGYFRDYFANVSTSIEKPIPLPNVDHDTFDYSIQWAMTRTVFFHGGVFTASRALDKLFNLIVVGDQLELDLDLSNPKSVIMEMILNRLMERNQILIDDRAALHGRHIRAAFSLPVGHPIRRLVIRAVLKPFVEYKQKAAQMDTPPNSNANSQERHLDAAHRAAYFPTRFRFQTQLETIADFENELLREFQNAWWNREVKSSKSGKKIFSEVFLTDPLTDELFRA